MPRLTIFNADEIKSFDKPPRFSSDQRETYFSLTPELLELVRGKPGYVRQIAANRTVYGAASGQSTHKQMNVRCRV